MGLIRFISGDGIEHEVEETSPAAAHMIKEGFQRLDENGDAWHAERDDLPAEEPEVTYTDAEAEATLEADEAAEAAADPEPAPEPPAPKKAPSTKKAAKKA